ncbi:MAG: sigma-70 family RNA polymerase sigma factor [Labilithrix sp.]|nr:sigma-70 family RNA polymerase sigma factor [Labilithrix sp.]
MPEAEVADALRAEREHALVQAHLPVVWRFLRRLGLSPEDADDATQEVFVVAVRKLDCIEPDRERSYLYAIAVRIASRQRRSQNVRSSRTVRVDVDECRSREPSADELLDRKDGLAFLDDTLSKMTPDLRTTFALYELEEMTMAEIAVVTEVPMGTVASRLRRAREQFQEAVKRMQNPTPRQR